MKTLFSWFIQFVSYNLVFMGFQIGYILFQSHSFINTLELPMWIYGELVTNVLVHLGLYLILSFLQTGFLWGITQRRFNISPTHWQIGIWTVSIAALLTVNGIFFPLSIFSRLFFSEIPRVVLQIICTGSLVVLCLLTVNMIYFAGKKYFKTFCCLMLLSTALMFYASNDSVKANENIMKTKPNIIIIGVDSLPPGMISSINTPNIDQFIKHSVYFSETISPLARTYPAWSSILTGLYPVHHGAQFNLMPDQMVKSNQSIAWHLQKAGFETIYATDDRRFNNIGSEFGFQQLIGPKVGVNDILLGTFNDFPISNWLINLPISQMLFPYNHLNRASHFSYYPFSFDHALKQALNQHNREKPLFMAVHFTLPHWPYAYASSTPGQVKDEYSVFEREQLFLTALNGADRQVHHFLQQLKHQGYLNNSLLILLSDHGETLYSAGSRQTQLQSYQGTGQSILADYFRQKTSTDVDKSAGHGSDLLSTDQYHCVLSWQIIKKGQRINPAKTITSRVALIDIEPTIRDFLSMSNPVNTDGMSLLSYIYSPDKPIPQRTFIMESGMLPNQFLSRETARRLGSRLFIVDSDSGKLQVREDQLSSLNGMKLYAVIRGDWLLALYPDDLGYITVTQRLSDGHWVDDLNSHFAQLSPSQDLLDYAREFYKKPFPTIKPFFF